MVKQSYLNNVLFKWLSFIIISNFSDVNYFSSSSFNKKIINCFLELFSKMLVYTVKIPLMLKGYS